MSDFETRRKETEDQTILMTAREILEGIPRLVSCHSPSGYGGIHYQDYDFPGPIGCTQEEAVLLNAAATFGRPPRILEIGSYVGWSSAHLIWKNKSMLDCVDTFTEGQGALRSESDMKMADRFLENMGRLGVESRVKMYVERSPEVLPSIAPEVGWDMVFVDGWHFDGQPLADVQGVFSLLKANAVVILHDLWIPDVRVASDWIVRNGWQSVTVPTANLLTFHWKQQPAWWNRVASIWKEISQ
jgi:predicted O-methyltransferase YrrM